MATNGEEKVTSPSPSLPGEEGGQESDPVWVGRARLIVLVFRIFILVGTSSSCSFSSSSFFSLELSSSRRPRKVVMRDVSAYHVLLTSSPSSTGQRAGWEIDDRARPDRP